MIRWAFIIPDRKSGVGVCYGWEKTDNKRNPEQSSELYFWLM